MRASRLTRSRCRPARVAAALIAALALAACGSAGSTSSSHNAGATGSATAASPPATVTRTTTVSSSPAGGSVSGTTLTGGGPAPCRAAGLSLRFIGQQGATGHGELGFAIRNTGRAPCRTFGYPGVQFLSASGALLPTRSVRTTSDFFGAVPVEAIVLAPGASASFRLAVTHGSASPAGCVTAHGLQAYPPDDTVTLRTTIPGGAAECGTATVSPMRPVTSAYR